MRSSGGVSGEAWRQRGGSEAARPRQRRSEARAGGAQVPARAQSKEGRVSEGEREREWREKIKVNRLT